MRTGCSHADNPYAYRGYPGYGSAVIYDRFALPNYQDPIRRRSCPSCIITQVRTCTYNCFYIVYDNMFISLFAKNNNNIILSKACFFHKKNMPLHPTLKSTLSSYLLPSCNSLNYINIVVRKIKEIKVLILSRY